MSGAKTIAATFVLTDEQGRAVAYSPRVFDDEAEIDAEIERVMAEAADAEIVDETGEDDALQTKEPEAP